MKLLKKLNLVVFKRILCIFMITTFMIGFSPITVKAQINEMSEEEMTSETAYLDMSSVGPLQLYFTEEGEERKPDYYYAAAAYHILQERAEVDSMYENCDEVIVTVNDALATDDVMLTSSEPQVKTGYLNLLSRETNKYYTIDNVIIQIQRDNK